MVLYKGIWDPKPRVTNIKGTNFKFLRCLEALGLKGLQAFEGAV